MTFEKVDTLMNIQGPWFGTLFDREGIERGWSSNRRLLSVKCWTETGTTTIVLVDYLFCSLVQGIWGVEEWSRGRTVRPFRLSGRKTGLSPSRREFRSRTYKGSRFETVFQ